VPLIPGQSGIGPNIKELAIDSRTGQPRPMKQRVAIALSEARKTGADVPAPKSYAASMRRGTRMP